MRNKAILTFALSLTLLLSFTLGASADESAGITSPADGELVFGTAVLEAFYNDPTPDNTIWWAVRKGTCAAGTNTVAGNVDTFSTPFTWDQTYFSATVDVSSWTPDMYCFVFNPDNTDGTPRLTRWFEVVDRIEVDIDIKPGSCPNSINLRSKGVVPVAVLTTADFDASTIDPVTVRFAGAAPLRWAMDDVDYDGDLDLVFHFKTQELNLDEDSTEAILMGETFDSVPFEGIDSVNIVP